MAVPGGPALVHTDLCIDLARGLPEAVAFFEAPPVEIRLSTATYLHLLSLARSPEEQARVRRFVSAYPVLSLGPMASSRAVELVQEHALTTGLGPLDALIAATALAHEIPLVARDPRPFAQIADLEVVSAVR
jgi:predicted nucleic acid-binding protein